MFGGRDRLAGKRLGILRPRVPLGELDQPLDLGRLAIERRCDQPGKDRARECADLDLPPQQHPRFDHRLAPRVAAGVGRHENQAFHQVRMAQRQFLRDQASQRLPHDMRGRCARRLQPAGHVVGQVGRRVRMIAPIALSRVAGIKGERAKPGRKMPLGPAERPVVAPHPTQEHERVAWLPISS